MVVQPRLLLSAFCLAALTACGDKPADDSGSGEPCGVSIDTTTPAADSTDAYYRGNVVFQLDGADESSPAITLTQGGTEIAGRTVVSEDLTTVTFIPGQPLDPSTSYAATLSYCTSDATIEFTTSELGEPLSADLTGRTYVVDLAVATYVEPEGVGDLISTVMTMPVLLQMTAVGGGELSVRGVLSVEGTTEQDYCLQSFDIDGDFTDSPYFAISEPVYDVGVSSGTIPLYDLEINGTFSADGSYFGGAVADLTVDAREIVVIFDDLYTWEELCHLTDSFGAPCLPCGDGAEACLRVRAEDVVGEYSPGQQVEEVNESDSHPLCELEA